MAKLIALISGNFRSSTDELVKSSGRAQDYPSHQQPRGRAQPAVHEPAGEEAGDDGPEQRQGGGIGQTRLAVNLFLVFFVRQRLTNGYAPGSFSELRTAVPYANAASSRE